MNRLTGLFKPLSKNTALIAFVVSVAGVITLASSDPATCIAPTGVESVVACYIVAHVTKAWLASIVIACSVIKLIAHSLTGSGGAK